MLEGKNIIVYVYLIASYFNPTMTNKLAEMNLFADFRPTSI